MLLLKRIRISLYFVLFIILVSFFYKIYNKEKIFIDKIIKRNNFLFTESTKSNICNSLNEDLKSILYPNSPDWTFSVLTDKGEIIAAYNSSKPMIPASNLKLLTTAYSLDVLGPTHLLKTVVTQRINGDFDIYGQGDPDLNLKSIKHIADIIKENTYKQILYKRTNIYLHEESSEFWWPRSWKLVDREKSYGAPISRLAVSSNAIRASLVNPVSNFRSLLFSYLPNKEDYNITISKHDPKAGPHLRKRLTIESAPMQSLLSLSNSESHNFTAEVLAKSASGSWDPYDYKHKISNWLKKSNLGVDNILIVDGSGLSRNNLLTSKFLTNLLYRMDNHKYRDFYISSMAIIGYRGTLNNFPSVNTIKGRFYGKTGTLNEVRTMSGYLKTDHGIRYISILGNNVDEQINTDKILSKMIAKIYNFKQCL